MFSLPKGTPKVHQVGLKNWQPAVASYQKGCKTTFLIEFAFAQQKIKNEPAHGLIIFFIIDTIATGSRSPAGPRRLGTATRISASLFRRLSAFFGSTPDQAPKAAKLAVLIPGHAGFPKRAERSEGSDTTPVRNAPVSACEPLCAILLRKPSVYPLSPVKANVGHLCEKLKNGMRSGLEQHCGGNFLAIFAGMGLGEKPNFLSRIFGWGRPFDKSTR